MVPRLGAQIQSRPAGPDFPALMAQQFQGSTLRQLISGLAGYTLLRELTAETGARLKSSHLLEAAKRH